MLSGNGDATQVGIPLSEALAALAELQEGTLQGVAQVLAVVKLPPAVESSTPGSLQVCRTVRVGGPHGNYLSSRTKAGVSRPLKTSATGPFMVRS